VRIPETLNEWKDKNGVKISAGIVVIQDNKILLVHPTGSPWWGTYSIPKGEVDKKEDILDAAIRETLEETGIKIKKKHIDHNLDGVINYTDNKGKIYKKVYYFVAFPKKVIFPGDFHLQYEEVDWAGFLPHDQAKRKIFGRFKPLLKLIE
jgi:8-oxo-dGTP diphosphatase